MSLDLVELVPYVTVFLAILSGVMWFRSYEDEAWLLVLFLIVLFALIWAVFHPASFSLFFTSGILAGIVFRSRSDWKLPVVIAPIMVFVASGTLWLYLMIFQ